MQLEITHTTLLKEIQIAFNRVYPNLWIDFYYGTLPSGHQARAEKIQTEMPLSNLGYRDGTKFINIHYDRRVEELERDFCENLGLSTKVLRKSGNVWVGTSLTGNWSLANQNSKGDQVFNE